MSVRPATWEAKIRGLQFKTNTNKVSKNTSQPIKLGTEEVVGS
jgi:hypothetical protein